MAVTAAQLLVSIKAETKQAATNIAEFAQSLGPGGILATAAAVAGAATIGIGVAAVKMAGDFQSGMTSLVTGAGESRDNLKLVSDGILQMAKDSGTSTKQLTDGMYMIESAGYHGKLGLDVLKAAAEGAKVGNADLGVVADATTTILKDYPGVLNGASGAVNTLVTTVANGKTHMQDLAAALSTVLPTGAAARVGLNDVMGAMATMTGEGVPAANAATYLRQTILALEAPSKGAQKALAEVGLSSKQVADEMHKSLPEALKMITEAVGKKFPEGSAQYVEAIKAISGGSKTMQGMLDLTGDHLKDFQANASGIAGAVKKGGDSITGWSDVQNTFNQKIDRAHEVFETLMIQLGTKLLPVAGQLADFFANNLPKAVDAVTGAVKNAVSIGQNLIKFFNDSGPAATTVKGIIIALGGAMLGMAATAIPAAVTGIIGSVAAFGAQTIAAGAAAIAVIAATWPFILIGAAIAIVIAIIIALVSHWSAVEKFFGNIGKIVSDTAGAVVNKFKEMFANIVSAVQAGFKWVEDLVQNAVKTVVGWFTWLYDHNYFFKMLVDTIKEDFEFAKNVIDTIWKAISGAFTAALNFIKGVVQSDIHTVVAIFDWLKANVIDRITAMWNSVINFVLGVATRIKGAVQSGVIDPIKSAIDGLVKNAEQWGANLLQMFIDGIKSKIQDLKNIVSDAVGGLGKILGFHSPAEEGPGKDADTWAPNLMKMFTQGITDSIPDVTKAATTAMQSVHSALSGSATGSINVAHSTSVTGAGAAIVGQHATANIVNAKPTATSGSGDLHVTLEVDGQKMGRVVLNKMTGILRDETGFKD